jgi:uncharacterized damage-inducible protein DinB
MPPPDLVVHPLNGYPPELGAALWMLEDTRRRTLEALDGLDPDHLARMAPGADNTIGSLLYHLAVIEVDWLYADLLDQPFPPWVEELFPHDARTDGGHLTPLAGTDLAGHLERLATVRRRFLEETARLGADAFRRPHTVESGVVTPEWILHHLCQHEAEHRGHIQVIRTALERG